MTKLTQSELLNNAFKEALHREEQRLARYTKLSKSLQDKRLGALFKSFADTSEEHIKQLGAEVRNYNIKVH